MPDRELRGERFARALCATLEDDQTLLSAYFGDQEIADQAARYLESMGWEVHYDPHKGILDGRRVLTARIHARCA